MSIEQFQKKFPDSPFASSMGLEELRAGVARVLPQRHKKTTTLEEVFPEFEGNDTEIEVFTDKTDHVPEANPAYVFPDKVTPALIATLTLMQRNRVWVGGWSGTGKTDLIKNVAARMQWELFQVNGDSDVTRSAFLGEWVVRGNETAWLDGILPTAMKRGAILLIDEIDMLAGPTFATLRPVLQDPSQLVLLEKGGEVVKAHPDFRVVATANTFGYGDMSGQFLHTNALSEADRQRFSVFLKLDYLDEKHEKKMIKSYFKDLTDLEIGAFLKVATAIRQKHKNGEMESSFSPRQLINWVEKYIQFGGNAEGSARLTFINSYPDDVQVGVKTLVDNAFPQRTVKKP